MRFLLISLDYNTAYTNSLQSMLQHVIIINTPNDNFSHCLQMFYYIWTDVQISYGNNSLKNSIVLSKVVGCIDAIHISVFLENYFQNEMSILAGNAWLRNFAN